MKDANGIELQIGDTVSVPLNGTTLSAPIVGLQPFDDAATTGNVQLDYEGIAITLSSTMTIFVAAAS